MSSQKFAMPAGGGKQATQFYQTAYVQNPGSSWVDKKMLEETEFEMTQADGVEPSIMFDDLAKTQMTFPQNDNSKAAKNYNKIN